MTQSLLETKHPADATAREADQYAEMVRAQFALIDRLSPAHKAHVWDWGYDSVEVRRLLAAQRREDLKRHDCVPYEQSMSPTGGRFKNDRFIKKHGIKITEKTDGRVAQK